MHRNNTLTQRTFYVQDTNLLVWVDAFLLDRKAQNLSKGTLKFYRNKLNLFIDYCQAQVLTDITQLTPSDIRSFLLYFESTGHNPGGIHAVYRTVNAFLRWYEREVEGFSNPIANVKAPRVVIEPLSPVELSEISLLLTSCQNGTFTGQRDKAILLFLLDSGCRAQEFLDLKLKDVNLLTGEVNVRMGKGRKPHNVYMGNKTRKAVRR